MSSRAEAYVRKYQNQTHYGKETPYENRHENIFPSISSLAPFKSVIVNGVHFTNWFATKHPNTPYFPEKIGFYTLVSELENFRLNVIRSFIETNNIKGRSFIVYSNEDSDKIQYNMRGIRIPGMKALGIGVSFKRRKDAVHFKLAFG